MVHLKEARELRKVLCGFEFGIDLQDTVLLSRIVDGSSQVHSKLEAKAVVDL